METKPLKIALLIDAENYRDPETLFEQFSEQITKYGAVVRKIAFGGWSYNSRLLSWKELCKIQNIAMEGLNGFKGKNAADRSLAEKATALFNERVITTVAIYSRDTGFAITFPAWKSMGLKIIVPKMGREFIPDADEYVNIVREKKNWQTQQESVIREKAFPTEFGQKLKEKLFTSFQNPSLQDNS